MKINLILNFFLTWHNNDSLYFTIISLTPRITGRLENHTMTQPKTSLKQKGGTPGLVVCFLGPWTKTFYF